MINVVFLGGPGSGKGTQAAFLSSLGYLHLSTGELFRKIVREDTDLSKEVSKVLSSGSLVEDSLVNKLVDDFYQKNTAAKGVILDGYPRNIEQAKFLDSMYKNKRLNLDFVFYLEIKEEILLQRILGRYSCVACGEVYNHFFNKTKIDGECDKCHSHDFIKRSDDTEEVVKRRLKGYHEETKPLLEFYADRLIRINANDQQSIVSENIKNFVLGTK